MCFSSTKLNRNHSCTQHNYTLCWVYISAVVTAEGWTYNAGLHKARGTTWGLWPRLWFRKMQHCIKCTPPNKLQSPPPMLTHLEVHFSLGIQIIMQKENYMDQLSRTCGHFPAGHCVCLVCFAKEYEWRLEQVETHQGCHLVVRWLVGR